MQDWATITPDGTIDNILTTIAEGENEIVRYLEYLFLECKYNNCRNLSSVESMVSLVAYKRSLAKSAVGYVIVSHTDAEGVNRLANYGTEFFDLDASSDYDDLTQNKRAGTSEKSALVPWTANEAYIIPKGTVFSTADGIKFISTQTVESRSLKEPFNVIRKDEKKYEDFISAGGWNGIKYLKIPVIQGEQRSTTIGEANGTRFESFTLDDMSVENASNVISSRYFTVTVTPVTKNGLDDVSETWEKIDNIRLAGPYEKVFETIILSESNKLLFKFGDGITGKMLPTGARITVNYLSTKGLSGNVQNKFQINSMALPNGMDMVDPRTNSVSKFLTCTNIVGIMGGKDIEDEIDMKRNAPSHHLKSYGIGSKKTYLKKIEEESPVNLLHLKLFESEIVDSESYGISDASAEYTSIIDDKTNVLQEITATRNALVISALRSNGEKIEDPENELLVPIRQSLDDYLSPNDSLEFIQPNTVEINPNITITTNDSILESTIVDDIKPKITARYSIFNRDFEQKYIKSEIIDICHNFSYAKSVDCFLEARTMASSVPTIISTKGNKGIKWLDATGSEKNDFTKYDKTLDDEETLFGFKFKFDKIFGKNKLTPGFKNYKYNQPYLLKVDITFKEDPTQSKSLLLIDNRFDKKNEISVNEGFKTPVDKTKPSPKFSEIHYGQKVIEWPDFYSEDYNNLQTRTAQFTKIDTILDRKAYSNLASKEIRPLLIEPDGTNKAIDIEEVASTDRVSLNFDVNIDTLTCYQKNWLFWENCKIEFEENFNDVEDENFASGQVIIPFKYILTNEEIATFKVVFENVIDFEKQAEELSKLLKDKISIAVSAITIDDDFETFKENDIIYSDKNNIRIEKRFIV